MSSSNHERIEKDDGFSKEDRASIVHQRRVWQVRKYSQVKPSSAHFDDGTVSFREENETADPALTALLRGLRNQLNADIVGATLLLGLDCMLSSAGHDIAPGRPSADLSSWSHRG